jgi:hypothetical protein
MKQFYNSEQDFYLDGADDGMKRYNHLFTNSNYIFYLLIILCLIIILFIIFSPSKLSKNTFTLLN